LGSWFALRASSAIFTSRSSRTDRPAGPLLTLRTRRAGRTLRTSRTSFTWLTLFALRSSLSRNDAVLFDQFEQLLIGQARVGTEISVVIIEVAPRKKERDDCQDQCKKPEREQTSMSLARFIDFRVLRLVLCWDFHLLARL
jgi:hypothetical protein